MGKRGPAPKGKLPVAQAANGMVVTSAKVDKGYEARERRHRAEEACRDIERAEKHRMDKELMHDVKVVAKEKIKAMGKIV